LVENKLFKGKVISGVDDESIRCKLDTKGNWIFGEDLALYIALCWRTLKTRAIAQASAIPRKADLERNSYEGVH
jgi:hypothetical protein